MHRTLSLISVEMCAGDGGYELDARASREVLKRDDFTCQTCGVQAAELPVGDAMRVGLIHRNNKSVQATTLDWKTLCPECDEGFAAATLPPPMNAQELIDELSRLPEAEQREIARVLLGSPT